MNERAESPASADSPDWQPDDWDLKRARIRLADVDPQKRAEAAEAVARIALMHADRRIRAEARALS